MGIAKELMLPNDLKIPTFSNGKRHVTIKMKIRNLPWSSVVMGSSDVGRAHASKQKKYVGIKRG